MELFEHRFWLQILGDHSRFISTDLAPKEKEKIKTAENFINLFDSLLAESKRNLSSEEIDMLDRKALQAAKDLRSFKLSLLREELTNNVNIGLPPTFINHMLNELEEYIHILNCLISNRPPSVHALHHHLLWLSDGYAHADSLASDLDMAEKELINISRKFSKDFQHKYLKAVELAGYLRTGLQSFPSLSKFNVDVELKMLMFQEFLKELQQHIMERKVLSRLSPLIPDHMYREECYFLTKLSQVSDIKEPECDPGSPRVES
jgi:hypothetical protein